MTREEAIEAIKCNWPDSRYTILREALDMAISALRQQGQELNAPLTLDELRTMDGEPVWIHFIGGAVIRNDGWFIVSQIGTSEIFLSGKVSVYKNFWYYGETWLAYRQKPEEGRYDLP